MNQQNDGITRYYFISAVRRRKGLDDNVKTDARCVGFYTDLDKAKEAVISNYYDINEDGYYQYAVIEQVSEGMYGNFYSDKSCIWFKQEFMSKKELEAALKDYPKDWKIEKRDDGFVSWKDKSDIGWHNNFKCYKICDKVPKFARGKVGWTIG